LRQLPSLSFVVSCYEEGDDNNVLSFSSQVSFQAEKKKEGDDSKLLLPTS
jgi:hypothetical protein